MRTTALFFSVLLLSTAMCAACAEKTATVPLTPSSTSAPAPTTTGQPGASIVFDSKGVDFGPWLREFIPSVRSHWFIPYTAMTNSGHVVVTFRVAKDGSIHNLAIKKPSSVIGFDKAAIEAVRSVQKAPALPVGYPSRYAHFTVTFFYNEKPPGQR